MYTHNTPTSAQVVRTLIKPRPPRVPLLMAHPKNGYNAPNVHPDPTHTPPPTATLSTLAHTKSKFYVDPSETPLLSISEPHTQLHLSVAACYTTTPLTLHYALHTHFYHAL